jgi:hypothetical protein
MSNFKRVVFEDWALWMPMISFGVFFLVFVIVSIRAILMHKPEQERLASLPLEDPSETSQS